MTDRTARRAVDRRTARLDLFQRMRLAHTIGAVRRGQTWYKAPPAPLPRPMTATRVARVTTVDPSVGLFSGAKAAAHRIGEHWADLLLQCPRNPADHRTVRIAGKPYHWRQDYTGQLKLAAGESPW
jgi:hypothetical protein